MIDKKTRKDLRRSLGSRVSRRNGTKSRLMREKGILRQRPAKTLKKLIRDLGKEQADD